MQKTFVLSVCAAFAALAVPAAAQQAAKQTPPPPGPVRPFQFPKYETKKLANGLTVYVIEDHRQPVISYRMEITTAGATAGTPAKAGLASFTAQLLRQGTKTRSAQEIASAIDRTGANLSSSAGTDTATISASGMKSAAPLALELMADIVQNPSFPQEEIDRLMRQTLSGLQVEYNDPQSLVQVLGTRVAYGTHPYAMPVEGTPDTVRGLKREDVLNFYKMQYGPSTAFLAIAGDVTPAEAFASAEKHFGSWKTTVTPLKIAAAESAAKRQIILLDKPDAVQTQFRLVQLAVPRNHPDFIPLQVANQIFGGSFNSRVNMKLRAAEGLTYGASSSFGALVHSGTFLMSSFTRTEKTATAIQMMSGLADELIKDPITDAELNEAKAYLAGSFVLSIETPAQVAGRVLAAAVNNLPPSYWDSYRDAIQGTTKDQVVAAIKKHVTPDKLNIVAVGNASQFAKELGSYGNVQIIPIADFDVTQSNYMRAKQAVAQSPEAKTRGLELARQAAEAMGGRDALQSIKSIRAKGSMTLSIGGQSMKGEVEHVLVYPDKTRMVITLPVAKVVQAYDGKVAWMQQGPKTQEMPPAAAAEMKNSIIRTSGIGVLLSVLDGSSTMVAGEPASLDGKTLQTATWTQGSDTAKLWFDPETKRIARIGYRGIGMSGPADVEVELGDYRKVGNIQLPHHMIVYQNGQKFSEQDVVEAAVNVDVDAASFTKPSA